MLVWIYIALSLVGILIPLAMFLLVVSLFLVALWEKCRINTFVALADQQLPGSAGFERLHRQTADLGFHFFGVYRDEETKLVQTRMGLYISDDGRVALTIPTHPKLVGYRFKTRTASDVWLMTGEDCSVIDPSGLIEARSLPGCSFEMVLRYHLDRVAERRDEVVPFAPETIVEDIREMRHERAQRSIDMGFARWVNPQQDTWSYNLRGAWRQVTGFFTVIALTNEANRLAEKYKTKDR